MSIGMTGIVTETETAATFDKPPAPCLGLMKNENSQFRANGLVRQCFTHFAREFAWTIG